ncbi:MAG: hypothetical protein ACRDX8_14275, partial [Acidimicrobiales bacterium]
FDAVLLKALKHGYAPVTTSYNSIYNQQSGPWFAMFSQAVYKGDVQGALKAGQSGFASLLAHGA